MSQVDSLAPKSRAATKAIWLIVAVNNIECVAITGRGKNLSCKTLFNIVIENSAETSSLQSLDQALQSIEQNLFSEYSDIAGINISIAEHWLAFAVLPWCPALAQKDSAREHAILQLIEAGFDVSAADSIRLDDAAFGEPRIALAYPAELLSILEKNLIRLNSRALSILPFFVSVWQLLRKPDQSKPNSILLLTDEDILILSGQKRRKFIASNISNMYLRRRDTGLELAENLAQVWQRLCLQQPQWAKQAEIILLDAGTKQSATENLAAPFKKASWLIKQHQMPVLINLFKLAKSRVSPNVLDVIQQPQYKIGWRWIFAGILGALVIFLSIQLIYTNKTLKTLTVENDKTAEADEAAQANPKDTAWSEQEILQVKATNKAIHELNLPFNALLSSLTPPRNIQVALMSVNTAENSPTETGYSNLKITAEAPTSADMTRYITFVSSHKPFTNAYLATHELVNSRLGKQIFRFTLEAKWND